ncbi:trypsin-like serine protease [Staphylococcus sp. 11007852]|uniref:trypsin-like serine peptidase n=1 Tax=Staphylococcus sp. 11007852 TaxID=2714543 RepID=UPI00140362F7|nr:trypsin-like serine protease [Staphylococcus sp. 11007852]NHM75852.1 trypsin-like serine protease [Staphylococcus sp. 11007852]
MKNKVIKLLLAVITFSGLFSFNTTLAMEDGTKTIVTNTQSDEIGRRVGIFEGPSGPCTATMLTPNFGLTAAHCGNGFKQNEFVGKIYPAQSALETPYGSMNITLFNPYSNKDIALIYGRNSDKDTSYSNYESTFAGNEIKLKGFTKDDLSKLVGKKVYSFGYPYNYDGHKQYKFEGKITFADENAIHTTMPSYGGQSGSAVFLENSKDIIGVLIQGGRGNKTAILQPITQDIASWYNSKKLDLENKNNNNHS